MRNDLLTIDLDDRRKRLGMSCAVLARRSGVSLPTVQRIMRHGGRRATFDNVVKVAKALGIEVAFVASHSESDVETMLEREARIKADRLARMAQGTSALEAQAVDEETVRKVAERLAHELLRSKRKLWAA